MGKVRRPTEAPTSTSASKAPASYESLEDSLVLAVRRRMVCRFATAGPEALALANIDEIADRMVAAMPDPRIAALDQAVGPFYDTAGLCPWLGVSRQALHKRIGKSILAVRTEDNAVLYPSFQFTPDGSVINHVIEIVEILGTGLSSPWSVALWLNTPVDELGNRTVADCLRAGDLQPARKFSGTEAARLTT